MAARTLAVRTCHVDGTESAVRMSEVGIQRVCIAETLLVGSLSYLLEQGCHIKEVLQGFFVRHVFNEQLTMNNGLAQLTMNNEQSAGAMTPRSRLLIIICQLIK